MIDVSASVNEQEYQLQAAGLGAAFGDPALHQALRAAAPRGIAISVIQWADQHSQQVSLDWTLIRSQGDARQVAARISAMPRLIDEGHTAIGDALAFGAQSIETNRFLGLRRVIDLSGDGRANDGRLLGDVRAEVVEQGITINGLAILNEIPLLDRYFRDHLIAGDSAFFMVAQDYNDFARAMTQKLVKEIRAVPLAEDKGPGRPDRQSTVADSRESSTSDQQAEATGE